MRSLSNLSNYLNSKLLSWVGGFELVMRLRLSQPSLAGVGAKAELRAWQKVDWLVVYTSLLPGLERDIVQHNKSELPSHDGMRYLLILP